MSTQSYPVAIIGAGPVGLAAAAHLARRKLPFVVLESGSRVASSVQAWGHVRLFSPWRYVIDDAARSLLEATEWQEPDAEGYPTGAEIATEYLLPLAEHTAIAPHIRTNTTVRAITRHSRDKMKNAGRSESPFVLQILHANGSEERVLASAVIDASGTYTSPNPAGADGLPALGETTLGDQIVYGIPDALGTQRQRYQGQRVLVIGSGHSAFNALLDLAQLPETTITWLMRRSDTSIVYGGGADDGLEERGKLGDRARQLVENQSVSLQTGFRVAQFEQTNQGVMVHSDDERVVGPFDQIVVCTGFRPDLGMLRELRLQLDPGVEAPQALAPLIDPNVHSCGSVPPHGVDELAHPEPGFYVVGMKSYGRAPTFLLLTGYEQVRSVTAALAGDWVSARDVQLVLPETGVCSGGEGSACCGPASPISTLQLVDLAEFRR
jgi:thioredoxin reductase